MESGYSQVRSVDLASGAHDPISGLESSPLDPVGDRALTPERPEHCPATSSQGTQRS
jgi:hypothetical protein